MRQGNDVGTQYRSGIYATTPAQKQAAEQSKAMYGKALAAKRYGAITTEILDAPPFYFAEDYHQQYLAKNPIGLLRARRHRRVVPDRHRRRRARTERCDAMLTQRGPRKRPSLLRRAIAGKSRADGATTRTIRRRRRFASCSPMRRPAA